MKHRNHTFDFLCGLCIIRMVMLHVFQQTGYNQDAWWKEVMDWSFYLMCFFFFKAGFFNHSVRGDTREYLADRTKRLLVPYITCGLIGVCLFWIFHYFEGNIYSINPLPFQWSHVWRVSDFYGNPPMWFLLSFYVVYILVHFIEKAKVLRALVVLFPVVGYVLYTWGNPLWLSLNNVFMGIFFFYLGREWRKMNMRLGRRKMFALSVVLVAVFVVGNIQWHGVYTMHTNDFTGNPWGAIVNSVVIVCGLSGLLLSLRLPRIPFVNYIGEHSMVYFVLHYPILFFYKNLSTCFRQSMVGHVNDVVFALLLVFIACTWLVPYFEATPLLSGRWKKNAPPTIVN